MVFTAKPELRSYRERAGGCGGEAENDGDREESLPQASHRHRSFRMPIIVVFVFKCYVCSIGEGLIVWYLF